MPSTHKPLPTLPSSLGRQVDVLISEPMGTLLVNERMIESYLAARDKHMKPGGKMFPVSRWQLPAVREEGLMGRWSVDQGC